MDEEEKTSISPTYEPSAATTDENQVNPMTTMTSHPAFVPIQDYTATPFESSDFQVVPEKSSFGENDVSLPTISSMNYPTNETVVAWLESAPIDTNSNLIDRSPSLPSTLNESNEVRDRRNSTVSTLCDQQSPSMISETFSSQQISNSSEIQRSHSFPSSDAPSFVENDIPIERTTTPDDDEDAPMQFFPVPESEESEVDKKVVKPTVSVNEAPLVFESRSPSRTESAKRLSNVSFDATVPEETPRKSSLPSRRRHRRESLNANQPSSPAPSIQRSVSYVSQNVPSTPSNTTPLHSHVLRKQFRATLSMPFGHRLFHSDESRQVSDLSDNVFRSISDSSRSSDKQFLPVPSSGSMISTDPLGSIISDIEGRSGIESSSLTDNSSQVRINPLKKQRSLSHRTRSSSTSTTESVEDESDDSSSDLRVNFFPRRKKRFGLSDDPKKTSMEKRQDLYKQLMWLVDQKQTKYARFNVKNRKDQLESSFNQRKSTPNPFVEFCSSFQSNNNARSMRTDGETLRNSNFNDVNSTLLSLPTQPLINNTNDPLNDSQTSIHSVHSDSNPNRNIGLINSQVSSPIVSLHSSLNLPRRRESHRRVGSTNLSTVRTGNELISQISQPDEGFDPASPLARTIESVLNEHLTMINVLLTSNSSFQSNFYPTIGKNEIYLRLNELSEKTPMHQRCSRIETKAFIDLITNFHMSRSHHYRFLFGSFDENSSTKNRQVKASTTSHSDIEEDQTFDGHWASDESSTKSSPMMTRMTSNESTERNENVTSNPLRYFRNLSPDFLNDCRQTEEELTKLFQQADQQHILYCLKHVNSGHSKDSLVLFHRQLDALYVWYNLYYELTISIRKLSCLLRCRNCDDWPHLRIRSIATARERRAKRAEPDDDYSDTSERSADEDNTDEEDENDSDVSDELRRVEQSEDEDESNDDDDDDDLLPTSHWSEEPADSVDQVEDSSEKGKFQCYRNFVYYMDKRPYQVKYDGLARTLIERVAPVLFKTRLALLQRSNRSSIKIEDILAGLSSKDVKNGSNASSGVLANSNHVQEPGEKLVDTDDPQVNESTTTIDIGELTIEQWLFHILKASSTVQTISSSMDDMLRENWTDLHDQLGLPSLLPFYFFIVNVLIDVMTENLKLYNKPQINNENAEIDSVSRQQLVRAAKLVLRDALATRVYTLRILDELLPQRHLIGELREFDDLILELYGHYRQYLSTVCVNRNYSLEGDVDDLTNRNADFYYYVDEETSELNKEYFFSRDLALTLGNQNEISDLSVGFSTLIQQILTHLCVALSSKTEFYYQTFAVDHTDRSASFDNDCSPEFYLTNENFVDGSISISDRTKKEIIDSTRIFRRAFDTIRQRTVRVCELAKILIKDFSIAAEFKCFDYEELWQNLGTKSYVQVKIEDTNDFDNFFVFVPSWLISSKDQVEKLLGTICSQSTSFDDESRPSFLIFVPSAKFHPFMKRWKGDVLYIAANAATQLTLNLTALESLHLVVNRDELWDSAVKIFRRDVDSPSIRFVRRSARYEATQSSFEQLPETIDKLTVQFTDLVLKLSMIWDKVSTKYYLNEIIKADERTIQSTLVDLILWIYKSSFILFRHLYELICLLSSNNQDKLKTFVCNMNKFYCEWCKCVTKKFHYISSQQARTAKNKVSRPKWFLPGLSFLSFLARSTHLQLLDEKDFAELNNEVPRALEALCGNAQSQQNSPTAKELTFSYEYLQLIRSSSTSSSHLNRPRSHRRIGSGGRLADLTPATPILSPSLRIIGSIADLEQRLEQKSRERKLIGKIYSNPMMNIGGVSSDPLTSLKARNIAFPWRRGTRIGEGGIGTAFRAINCLNGSIVCMKEMFLKKADPETLRRIANEIDMIMTIEHPNIVRYFGIERYKRTIYICMEYCLCTVNEFLQGIRDFEQRAHSKRKESVFWADSSDQEEQEIDAGRRLTSSTDINEHVRGFVEQLLRALMALHEQNIVHCDVKGDNIFISNENGRYIVKLGDFNLSLRLQSESPPSSDGISFRSTQNGTIYFQPPESEYVCKSDIWALGCTIIEMLTGKFPWTNVMRHQNDKIYIQNQLFLKVGPPIPDDLQQEAREFIKLCLKPDPEERKSARELLNEAYPRVRIGDT